MRGENLAAIIASLGAVLTHYPVSLPVKRRERTKESHQTVDTDMQRADVQRRPSGAVDCVVARRRALPRRLLFGRHPGLLGLDALGTIEHHLDHGILHQRGEAEQQAGDEPDVDGLDVGDLGQLRGQRGALRGQGEDREDSCERETGRATSVKRKRLKLCVYVRSCCASTVAWGWKTTPKNNAFVQNCKLASNYKVLVLSWRGSLGTGNIFCLLDEEIQWQYSLFLTLLLCLITIRMTYSSKTPCSSARTPCTAAALLGLCRENYINSSEGYYQLQQSASLPPFVVVICCRDNRYMVMADRLAYSAHYDCSSRGVSCRVQALLFNQNVSFLCRVNP